MRLRRSRPSRPTGAFGAPPGAPTPGSSARRGPQPRQRPWPALRPGDPAPVIIGADLSGQAVELTPGSGPTVLYFLTSSCRSCQPVWAALGRGEPGVAITPDAATEDRRKLAKLARAGTALVLSTDAWLQYGVGPAPWRVVVESGVIVSAASCAETLS